MGRPENEGQVEGIKLIHGKENLLGVPIGSGVNLEEIWGELLKKVKKKLNPSQKRTMELVLENDMSYQEAASEMCCSVGTVMSSSFQSI